MQEITRTHIDGTVQAGILTATRRRYDPDSMSGRQLAVMMLGAADALVRKVGPDEALQLLQKHFAIARLDDLCDIAGEWIEGPIQPPSER